VVARFRDAKNVVAAFTKLRADWDDYLGRFTVETPDPVVNAMLNLWNPIQCRTTLFWSRFVSAYETGTGRGMGTRDSAQDTLGTVHNAADRAARHAQHVVAPAIPRWTHLAPGAAPDRRGRTWTGRRISSLAAVVL